jgi:4-hydroxybenzoyl-CoA thioesterase
MPRIRLQLPATLPFTTVMSVRVTDVNYGGHLGNDAVLGLAHEARIRFLASLGFRETDVGGTGIIMTDAVVIYRSEAFLGDRLEIGVGVGEVDGHACEIYYRIANAATRAEVARVRTGLAFYDYGARRIAATPEVFRAALSGLP